MQLARGIHVAAVSALLVVVATPAADGAEGFTSVKSTAANGRVGIDGGLGIGHHSVVPGQVSSPDGPGSRTDVDYYLSLVSGTDGPCIGWTTNAAQSLTTASAGAVLALYGYCPAEEDEEVPPAVIAETEILRFWQTKPVPRMQPQIDPGYAIAGLRAYLETGADSATTDTLTFDTPVGRAQMNISANYHVDWGDGTAVETYPVNGGPWPDGEISHVFQASEPVTVTISQVWTGSWRMMNGLASGVGGQLPQLPMHANLDLLVDQVQAVVGEPARHR